MCFWIFHQWENRRLHIAVYDPEDTQYFEATVYGRECLRCGGATPGNYREALNWMKEEVLK